MYPKEWFWFIVDLKYCFDCQVISPYDVFFDPPKFWCLREGVDLIDRCTRF